MQGRPARVPSPCIDLKIFRDNHFGVRQLAAAFPAAAQSQTYARPEFAFSPAPPRKPINRPKEKNHRDHQPRIPRRNSHCPEYHNVPCRHQQRWNYDNQQRSIHRRTIFPHPLNPGPVLAPGWCRFSHKMTSVTRATRRQILQLPGDFVTKIFRQILRRRIQPVLNGSRSFMNW